MPKVLSPQEARVLSLSATGMVDKEIGAAMGVGLETVRTYWRRVHAKLGTRGHTAAVLEGVRRREIAVEGVTAEAAHV